MFYLVFSWLLLSLSSDHVFFPPHYIIFSLNTNPSHIPEPFFTPCSKIDYSQENFCVETIGSSSVLVELQWCLHWFAVDYCCLWAVIFFPPHHIMFRSIQTPHISQDLLFTPCSLMNSKTICMDWIAWVWYISEPNLFHIFKSCHVWLFKILFSNRSRMQDEFFQSRYPWPRKQR